MFWFHAEWLSRIHLSTKSRQIEQQLTTLTAGDASERADCVNRCEWSCNGRMCTMSGDWNYHSNWQHSNYAVSQKNVPPLACYNFDTHKWILTFFGRNVTDKVGNQKTLDYAISSNLCFCTIWQNGKTRKSHFSLNWTVLHAQCTCALSSWETKLMCLIASNIC